MKICRHCQTTYSDESLNFYLQNGSVLETVNTAGNLPETVMVNRSVPQTPKNSLAHQGNEQANNVTPAQSAIPSQPKNSTTWLWVIGILGMLVLICGGGFIGFIAWLADLEDSTRSGIVVIPKFDRNAISDKNPEFDNRRNIQSIDSSKWNTKTERFGKTEYVNDEFLMSSKKQGFYFVLVSSKLYRTEDASTKVAVRNIDKKVRG